MDLMLITATEDIDNNQIFFENKSKGLRQKYQLENYYELDDWDVFRRIEGEFDEKDKISDRQKAIRRIQRILQEVSSNE